MNKISFFKPYLQNPTTVYKGGKTRDDVQAGKKIYKMSSNENPLGTSPLALKALEENVHLVHEYPDRTGVSLQVALSDFYKGQLKPNQFVTANSGVEILELIAYAFLGEGLECIVSNPAFKPYIQFPEKVGAKIVDVPLVGKNFWLDIDGIINEVNENTRIVWVCNPNNPTGTYIPKNQIDELLDRLPDHVVLIYDEVYYQFVDAEDYTTGLTYVNLGRNVIAVNSFSKAYGLAGMRVGYAYTTEEIANYINQTRRLFMLNTLALESAQAALKDEAFIALTVKTVAEGKAYLYSELDKLGMQYWKSQTNFIMMKPTMNDLEFEEKMLAEGIMVRPVAGFGAPDCIRVTIGTMEANEAFITALKKILA